MILKETRSGEETTTRRLHQLRYRDVCTASAAIAVFLFAIYLFWPSLLFLLLGSEGDDAARMMSGRAAMLFLALGLIYWQLRDVQDRTVQSAIMCSSALAMAALMLFGVFQLLTGGVGFGQFAVLALEGSYLVAFILILKGASRRTL